MLRIKVYPEITQNGSLNSNYILRDWLGTPRVTLDGSGTVVQATDIDPYGRVMDLRSYVAGAEADRYRFTGHAHDAESGYDYHGARYYQPELGRYLGVDVMAISRAWVSSYNYVQGNPVNRVDPTGMLDDEYDQFGRKISDLGGDKIDFFHQADGNTKIVDRETGASNLIFEGERLIKGYDLRKKDIGWDQITNEFFTFSGPTKSMIADFEDSKDGAFLSLNSIYSAYSSAARTASLNSKESKGKVLLSYAQANPILAIDMWEQMWGRTVVSWYKLGDKTLFMMNHSKSAKSLLARIGPTWERESFPLLGNTYQTYIWTESNAEISQKVRALRISKQNDFLEELGKSHSEPIYQKF